MGRPSHDAQVSLQPCLRLAYAPLESLPSFAAQPGRGGDGGGVEGEAAAGIFGERRSSRDPLVEENCEFVLFAIPVLLVKDP